MNFIWSDYLDVANTFVNQSRNSNQAEALQRTVISRAYYSVFVTARNYLRDKQKDPNIPSTGDAHTYVSGKFFNNVNQTWQEIGSALFTLRRERRKADYDDTYPNIANTAVFMLAIANDAMDKISRL
jgi:uncharacterized protein (UPF0332 family)